MKPHLATWVGLVALLLSAGCVVSRRAEKNDLPADWVAALPGPGLAARDIAGIYVDHGERVDARSVRNGRLGTAGLSTFFSTFVTDGAEPAPRPANPNPVVTLELRRADDTHLELIILRSDGTTQRRLLEVEFEKATGAMVLRADKSVARAEALSAIHATVACRFWRGPDGRLYAQSTSQGVGGVLLIVPTVISTEVWCRWEVASPEALRKQAAAHAQLAASTEHRATVNRNRATEGAKAPSLAGATDLTGHTLTTADHEGKVVVVHAWSTNTGDRSLTRLKTIYSKYHSRGLEIVSVCTNPAGERGKVTEFVKARGITWPQLYDEKGVQGALFEAFYGTNPGSYCVIDRRGNVAALVGSTAVDKLETAIVKALAPP